VLSGLCSPVHLLLVPAAVGTVVNAMCEQHVVMQCSAVQQRVRHSSTGTVRSNMTAHRMYCIYDCNCFVSYCSLQARVTHRVHYACSTAIAIAFCCGTARINVNPLHSSLRYDLHLHNTDRSASACTNAPLFKALLAITISHLLKSSNSYKSGSYLNVHCAPVSFQCSTYVMHTV
jgi:hypothetical protein